jgi:nicotinamide phosphoribosyltransferase
MIMHILNPMLMADFYKISHRLMYPEGCEVVYSTWTPRASRLKDVNHVVSFGQQAFIKSRLIEFFDENFFQVPEEEIIEDYSRIIKNTLGVESPDVDHIRELHQLGYLPLSIKSIPEGMVVPLRVPMLTIHNTHPKFFWLTNYIETLASCELWQSMTSATIANEYRMILDNYAKLSGADETFVQFQGHDFSMRGMSSLGSAMLSGMGHLLSFAGTDTIPAIQAAELLYNADVTKELVGTSIPASEHSIQCAYEDDMEYLDKMITKVHPSGFVSVVSDGYDFWDVIGRVIPALKDRIMDRDGRVVIRPDSGDPVLIVCGDPEGKTELERKGAVEALWDIFGGTITSKGYKQLNSHIGLIYGDAITLRRCEDICQRLMDKGFASTNSVFGIGSYTYQYNTRDTFGFALKSTLCVINGKEKMIFKDPKTDNGIKKSQKGAVAVVERDGQLVCIDGLNLTDTLASNKLIEIYRDGVLLVDDSFSNIRERLSQHRKSTAHLKRSLKNLML